MVQSTKSSWIMKKQFSIFLAVIFLSVQMGSFVHMAEHGFEHHDHGGNPCQVEAYFHASQSFDNAYSELAFAHIAFSVNISYSFADDVQQAFEGLANNHARAPPHIS